MSLPLKVIKIDTQQEVLEPYILRIGGWTEERYFKEAPETGFVEFEDGEIIMHSPVNIKHQKIVHFLTFLLTGYVSKHDLGMVLNGPAVVRLRANLDYEPDIFFISKDQLEQLKGEYFLGAPALIIEVLSSVSRNHDLKTKAVNYRRYGVPEYWAIDPEYSILYQHTLPKALRGPYSIKTYKEGKLASKIIAGFWIEVSWLWQEPLPRELSCLEEILPP